MVAGTFINLTAATVGALLAFLLARHVAGKWARTRIGGRLDQLVMGVESEGWRFVAFVRLAPISWFSLLNHALGLTRIGVGPYVLATYLGMLPGALAYTYLSYAGREALTGGEDLVRKGLCALALLAAALFLPRLVKGVRASTAVDGRSTGSRRPVRYPAHMDAATLIRSVMLFVAAGVCEIGGGYLVWLWLRDERAAWLGALGGLVLFLYGVLPTFQPAHFGRVRGLRGRLRRDVAGLGMVLRRRSAGPLRRRRRRALPGRSRAHHVRTAHLSARDRVPLTFPREARGGASPGTGPRPARPVGAGSGPRRDRAPQWSVIWSVATDQNDRRIGCEQPSRYRISRYRGPEPIRWPHTSFQIPLGSRRKPWTLALWSVVGRCAHVESVAHLGMIEAAPPGPKREVWSIPMTEPYKKVSVKLDKAQYERVEALAEYAGLRGRTAISQTMRSVMRAGLDALETSHRLKPRLEPEPAPKQPVEPAPRRQVEDPREDPLVTEALSLFGGKIVNVEPHRPDSSSAACISNSPSALF